MSEINKFGKELIVDSRIHSGPDNDIFLVHAHSGRKYIMRTAKRIKTYNDFIFERDFSRFLYNHKIPVRLLLGAELSGKGAIKSVLMSYRQGTKLSGQNISRYQAANAGKMLAKFHLASRHYKATIIPARRIDDELQRIAPIQDKIEYTFSDGSEFVHRVNNVLQSPNLSDVSTNVMIHNDFRVQNLLFKRDNVSAILDFDWVCRGNAMKDLAHAMVEWSFPDGGNFSSEIFKSFFNGYISENSGININTLQYWIEFSCLSDTCTYIADNINDFIPGDKIMSWMYAKYLFFQKQDIRQLIK